jgi:hypothetical protein
MEQGRNEITTVVIFSKKITTVVIVTDLHSLILFYFIFCSIFSPISGLFEAQFVAPVLRISFPRSLSKGPPGFLGGLQVLTTMGRMTSGYIRIPIPNLSEPPSLAK